MLVWLMRHASIVGHDDGHERVIIPFFLRGVTSLFHIFAVEADEFEQNDCPRVELTSNQLTWDTSSTVLKIKRTELSTTEAR